MRTDPTQGPAVLFATAALFAASPASAQAIQTGAQLHTACQVYAVEGPKSLEASRNAQDPCRRFLVDFLFAFKTQNDQGTLPLCVRMPDSLTYVEFAQRIVAHGERAPASLQGAAPSLARDTLAHDFPCPDKPR